MGRDRIRLLQAVAREGSITAGAKAAGLTYKAAWDALDAMANLFGRPLLETRTGGRAGGGARLSPTGVREWYRADAWTPLADAHAERDGEDLGAVAPLHPPAGFGFSEAPKRPSLTAVRPLLEDPSGALDHLVATLHGERS